MAFQLGSAYGKIVIDLSGVDAALKTASSRLTQFETHTKRIGQSLSDAGQRLTMGLTLPLAAVGAASIKMGSDFEASMQSIVGLVGVSQQQVNAWKTDLATLGPQLGQGPKQLADALYFVTSAGLKGKDALDVVVASAKAASAGLGETKIIADATSSALNAYGPAAITAGKATAILVATVREGKAEASDIAPALGRVIPVAAQLGISFDQVGAAMAAMTRVGFDAAESGTNISGIMSALLKPTKQAADILAEFGLSGEMLRKKVREEGLLSVLQLLKDTIGQNDEALAAIFPNIRAFRGLLSLVGENAESTRAIFKALANTTEDELDRAFGAMTDTAQFKFKQALATVQTALIQLSDAVLPVVVPMVESLAKAIKDVADWFAKLDPQTQQTIVSTLALVAALGPALVVIGKIVSGVGALVSVVHTLGSTLATGVKIGAQFAKTGFEVVQYLAEAGAGGLVAAGAFAALAVGVAAVIKFLDAAGRAARATNAELVGMANANTGNVIEDTFTRAGASFELMVNGSNRLRDVFIEHQDEMRAKLERGEITLQEYNTEIERSAREAGVWKEVSSGLAGVVTRIDSSVKVLTEDQLKLERAVSMYADIEGIRAQRVLTSTGALKDLSSATNEAVTKQRDFTDELERLKALIAGPIREENESYNEQLAQLTAQADEYAAELEKLRASQGAQIEKQNESALGAEELAYKQALLADKTADLAGMEDQQGLAALKLQADIAKLKGQIDEATGSTVSYIDNSKKINEIQASYDGVIGKVTDLKNAHAEAIKSILFDLISQRAAIDGVSGAEFSMLTTLAQHWGLVDEDTAAAMQTTNDIFTTLEMGTITVGQATTALEKMGEEYGAVSAAVEEGRKVIQKTGGQMALAAEAAANLGSAAQDAGEKIANMPTSHTVVFNWEVPPLPSMPGAHEAPVAFQHGGRFVVQGPGGIDRVPVSFMATAGEVVEVIPAHRAGRTSAMDERTAREFYDYSTTIVNDHLAMEIVEESKRRKRREWVESHY